jgi:hypothetical protein
MVKGVTEEVSRGNNKERIQKGTRRGEGKSEMD